MNFHEKYRDLPDDFELIEIVTVQTTIVGYEYEDSYVKLTKEGLLYIFPGFEWSASGPTIDSPWTRRASLYHDALYYISNQGTFKGSNSKRVRKLADKLFLLTMKEDLKDPTFSWYEAMVILPVRHIRCRTWYYSVRAAGWAYWEEDLGHDPVQI